MSNVLSLQTIHSIKQEKSNRNRKKKLRIIVLIIIAILITILIGEIIFHLFIAPYISLQSINVVSDMEISNEQAIEMGNIPMGELFYQVNEVEIQNAFLSDPSIQSAVVRRLFPNGLRITLNSRSPLGIVMVNYNDIVLPALIDEEGVVYKIGYEIDTWDLPIIQGVQFNEFQIGARVEDSYIIMLNDIRFLNNDNSNLLQAFSEFRIDEVYNGVYEWVLIPIHLPVQIRTSSGLDYEQGMYILKILEFLKERENITDIIEIDFRAGDVVYNKRGETNGL